MMALSLNPTSNKSVSHDPFSCGPSVWKAAANLFNYIEGTGFPAVPCAFNEGGIAASADVGYYKILIILWYVGNFVLIERFITKIRRARNVAWCHVLKTVGYAFLPKYGVYVVHFCVIHISISAIGFLPCTLRILNAQHFSICTHHIIELSKSRE